MPEEMPIKKKSPAKRVPNQRLIQLQEEIEELRDLVEKNLKWSQIIYEQHQKMIRRQRWMFFFSMLKLMFIIIPLILAVLYLPPILQQAFDQYQSLLGNNGTGIDLSEILSNSSPEEIKNYIDKIRN